MTAAELEEARTEREDRRERRLDRVRTGAAIIAVVLLAALVWYTWDSQDAAEEAVSTTQGLAQQVQAACRAGGAAERELDSIGACEDARQAVQGAAVAAQPAPVVEVATDNQVRAAVTDYLTRNPPADGRLPTQAEVDAAVSRYCAANACRGSDGTSGTNGTDGADGADGADATDDQVAAEVRAYCAQHNGCLPTSDEIRAAVAAYCEDPTAPGRCVGPAGAQGAEGPPGPVLPEYTITNELGVTKRCVLDVEPPPDPEAPPHYICTLEGS
jgi:hypothetical protein